MLDKKLKVSRKPAAKSSARNIYTQNNLVSPEIKAEFCDEQAVKKMKRLTLDIPESLHRSIKIRAVERGVPMVDMLRELLEKHYGK